MISISASSSQLSLSRRNCKSSSFLIFLWCCPFYWKHLHILYIFLSWASSWSPSHPKVWFSLFLHLSLTWLKLSSTLHALFPPSHAHSFPNILHFFISKLVRLSGKFLAEDCQLFWLPSVEPANLHAYCGVPNALLGNKRAGAGRRWWFLDMRPT